MARLPARPARARGGGRAPGGVRRPGLPGLPALAPEAPAHQQRAGAHQQGDEAQVAGRAGVPEPPLAHAAGRRRDGRRGRGLAAVALLLRGQGGRALEARGGAPWRALAGAPGEVDEIWVTFPDPQIKKERKRLVGPHFVNDYYRRIWPANGGILHLKSDSDFLYEYLLDTAKEQRWELLENIPDVYAGGADPLLTEVQTFYEKMWLAEGKTIHYVRLKT